MRVLVTRPAEAGARTARALARLGHEAILAPVLEIVPTGAPLPEDDFGALLATSAQAFAGRAAPVPPGLADIALFLVGARTAAAAAKAGFRAPPVVAADISRLAAEVRRLLPAGRLLNLAGVDRKPELEIELRAAGYDLATVETYEARATAILPAPAAEALQSGRLDAILHFSRRSAEIFCRLTEAAGLATAAARVSHQCISADAAEPLARFGARRIAVAKNPDEAALLATLQPP